MAAIVAVILFAISLARKTTVDENRCGRVWVMLCIRPWRQGSRSICSRKRPWFRVRQKQSWFRASAALRLGRSAVPSVESDVGLTGANEFWLLELMLKHTTTGTVELATP